MTSESTRRGAEIHAALPETTPALRRALDILYCQLPMAASTFGAEMWPNRTSKGFSSGGGGDYAAQMLLGRLRRKGWAQVARGEGSSRWELTAAGKTMCRPFRTERR